MGILGWSPREFWGATMHDLMAAQEGYRIAQGDPTWHNEAMASELRAELDNFMKGGN